MITEGNKLTGKTTPLIAWVVVNFFNDADTLNFINKEYMPQQDGNIRMYVVNNGSKNEMQLIDSLKNFKLVFVISNGKNLGYMGAFCFAINHFFNSYQVYPSKAILSNTDLILPQNDFVKGLLNLHIIESVACVGPQIIHAATNRNQNPLYVKRPSKLKLRLLSFIFAWYPLYLVYQYLYYFKNNFTCAGDTYLPKNVFAIHGSFMILPQHFLKKFFTDLKEAPFLLGEELFIAELCRKYEMNMEVDYRLKVIHNEHTVTGKYKSKEVLKHLRNSS
ncbi:MAG: glycosyltransferase [Bacteroidetes bacterium]|nr:glycosyltransferase [Bacteroidota bacterium]